MTRPEPTRIGPLGPQIWILALTILSGATLGFAAPPEATRAPHTGATLARVEAAEARGEITRSEATRQRLYYLFDRSRMDRRWWDGDLSPARCGTTVLDEIRRHLDGLDAETRSLYQRYTQNLGIEGPTGVQAPGSVYETTHFYIEYSTNGQNGVPTTDVNPANGVPDHVERTAEACEYSWTTEITNLGYVAPQLTGGPNNKYLIQYQTQQSYGYTTVVSGLRTKIVLHPNFTGFPPNDDPDGDVLGALRVTVAHEFKHASQRMYDAWGEGGWVELDATWMEDIVYDGVNDYYNYLRGAGSPFTEPQTPLDNGGTGSYEDANWQHFQTEKLTNAVMYDFWQRRLTFGGEPVLTTYAQTLLGHGTSFGEVWGEYVAWNFACGSRTDGAFGYGEANRYWATPTTSTHTVLPVPTTGGSVEHLAAHARLISNHDRTLSGTPEFTFTGAGGADWRVSVVLRDLAGTVTRVPMTLGGGVGTLLLSGYDWTGLEWAGLVIGNANTAGAAASYTFSAHAVSPVFIAHQPLWHTTNTTTSYTVTATVTAGSGTPDPASVQLAYRIDGGSETVLAMTATGNPDEYAASIPAQSVGRMVEYRIGAQSTLGDLASSPASGYYAFHVATVFEPFETAGAWTVGDIGDAATTGLWVRAAPVGTVCQPDADHTSAPGTACFVTANGAVGSVPGEADVDGGKTTLLSPVIDLSSGGPYSAVTARYRRWYSNQLGSELDDTWRVDASNDGGAAWVNVETASLGDNRWTPVSVDLLALFGTPDQVRFRFVAEDGGAGSLVEAAVDDFELAAVQQGAVGVPNAVAAELWLGPAVPNPARGSMSLVLRLPEATSVSAVIRDLQGRMVRTLVPAGTPFAAGSSTIRWNGLGAGGRALPAGVYFLRVTVGDRSLQRRVVLLP